jgi:phosphatidylglycerol:prolipoprotein diacylglycerol transferase
MLPTFQLGPWVLQTYNTTYALALLIAGLLTFRRLRQTGRPPEILARNLPLVIAAGFVGTYALGIVPTLRNYFETGRLVWIGATSFVGTLAFAIPMALYLIWKSGGPLWLLLDRGIVPWALFLAIGRVGCWGAGCCYGKPTDSWTGMYLRNVDGVWAERYPTQLISGLANLLLFFLLLAFEQYGQRRAARLANPAADLTTDPRQPARTWPFDGFVFLLYLACFSLERFTLEFLRGDATPLLGPFSWVHLATFAAFILVLILIAQKLARARPAS